MTGREGRRKIENREKQIEEGRKFGRVTLERAKVHEG